jgi:hypothetical protein
MLRLFGKGLSQKEAAGLSLFLTLSEDPLAREVGDLIAKSMLEPFPTVTLTDAERDAARAAVEAGPPALEWARKLMR